MGSRVLLISKGFTVIEIDFLQFTEKKILGKRKKDFSIGKKKDATRPVA